MTDDTTKALALRPTETGIDAPAPGTPGSPEFERNATHLAHEYAEATAEIVRLVDALRVQTQRLDEAFCVEVDPDYRHSRFGVEVYYDGHRHNDVADVVKAMERRAWDVLVDKLGIKNVMSVKARTEFDEQLRKGELPPINEQTIASILLGLAGQADQFAKEAAREVFELLRPRGHLGGQYATNNAFRVGKRVILPYRVERKWGGDGWHVTYGREQELTAIDGVFHLLDGKGIMRENRGPLVNAINAAKDNRGETAYFRFKCFKNRNLHLEFKDLELVKQLNLLAVGERVLGEDVD